MKWTLVTGGAKRLGAQICRTLASKGHSLLIHYRNSYQEAKELAAFCRTQGAAVEIISGDFSTNKAIDEFAQKLRTEKIKYLVHNVGPYSNQPFSDNGVADWHTLFQLNFFAPVRLTQHFLPTLKLSEGSILALGVSGLEGRSDRDFTGYRLSKLCLLRFMRNLAREVAGSRVQVNMVSPGQLDLSVDLPENIEQLPMHRAGTAEEVAQTVAFLLEQRYITGQNIEVSGGLGL